MPRVRKPKQEKPTVTGTGAPVVEGLAEVVNLTRVRKTKTPEPKSEGSDLHAKYPWVVEGSIREVAKGERIDRGNLLPFLVSKGRVCTVECTECGTTFEINVQDAFQVKMCPGCKRKASKERRQARREAREAKQEVC